MSDFQGVIHLTEEQYLRLKTNGSITFGDTTLVFDENTLYVTDEAGESGENLLNESKLYTDQKVADLVNSAPETLDTLGEVAQAIAENESVVEALNSAIGNKADKSEVTALDTRVTELENAESPEIDTSTLVLKEDFDKLVNNETQIVPTGNNLLIGGASLKKTSSSYSVGVGQNVNVHSNSVAIGSVAKAQGSGDVSIGNGAYTTDYGTAVGLDAWATGTQGVAIGQGAKAENTKTIQLGNGKNNTANTLQVFGDNIYNHSTHTLTVQNIELNGENLATKLENASGGITQETDPTVPSWAKEENKPTYTYEEIQNKPTNVSAFNNDAGYLTEIPSDYVTETELSGKGYATTTDVNNKDTSTLNDAKSYTDTKIANLINSAPETLDTLGEIAVAMQENKSVVEALNGAIGTKADKAELNNYLPLTAGSDKKLTGDLYVQDGTNTKNFYLGKNARFRDNGSGGLIVSTVGAMYLRTNGDSGYTNGLEFDSASLRPQTNDGNSLGKTTNKWKEIHGTTIYQNGNKVIDTSGGTITGDITLNTNLSMGKGYGVDFTTKDGVRFMIYGEGNSSSSLFTQIVDAEGNYKWCRLMDVDGKLYSGKKEVAIKEDIPTELLKSITTDSNKVTITDNANNTTDFANIRSLGHFDLGVDGDVTKITELDNYNSEQHIGLYAFTVYSKRDSTTGKTSAYLMSVTKGLALLPNIVQDIIKLDDLTGYSRNYVTGLDGTSSWQDFTATSRYIGDGRLQIQRNGVLIGEYSARNVSDKVVNIEVPTIPTNIATTDTTQTISGAKTFSSATKFGKWQVVTNASNELEWTYVG